LGKRSSILLKSSLFSNSINTYLFISLIAGIFAGWCNIIPSTALIILSFLLLFCLVLSLRFHKGKLFPIVLIIFFISLGALWVTPYSLHKPSSFLSKNNEFIIKVTSLPQDKYLKRIFYARVIRINNYPANINVKVNCFCGREVEYRDTYILKGRLTRHRLRNSYFYTLWIRNNSFISHLPTGFVDNSIRSFTYKIIAYFRNNLSCEAYKFLSSVFLGRRELLDKNTRSVFINAAAAHLIAISGLHVGLLSAVFFFVLNIFRVKFKIRIMISIAAMALYALCVGLRPSIVRSFLMFSFMGTGFLLKRNVSIFDTLSVSGIVCLLWNPLWVFDIGFQLSFAAVFAIVLGMIIFPFAFTHKHKLIAYVKGIFFSTLFVTIAIIPLVALYFGKFCLVGILSNLILIPVFTLIVVTTFTFICFYFFHFLASILAEALSLFVFVFIKTATILGAVKFSSLNIDIGLAEVIIYYAALGIVIVLIHYRNKLVRTKKISKALHGL